MSDMARLADLVRDQFPRLTPLIDSFLEEWGGDDVPVLLIEQIIAPFFAELIEQPVTDRRTDAVKRVGAFVDSLAADDMTWNDATTLVEWLASSSSWIEAFKPHLGEPGNQALDHALRFVTPGDRTVAIPGIYDVAGAARETVCG